MRMCNLGLPLWSALGTNQVHGDWQSDDYKIYLGFSSADKLSVSEAMTVNLKS